MKKEKKKKINKNIIIACVIALLVILAILAAVLIHSQNQKNVINSEENNTLYIEEESEEESEEDVLVVELNKNEEEEEEEQEETVASSDTPYYIKVNIEANVVTIYKKDSTGEYNTAVKAMVCSVGTSTPTSGVYKISDKYTWRLLVGGVYGQYACRITGSILFHSVPYTSKDKSTLEWWEYDKLGTKASLGCVRLTVADAKWIYDNCVAGTQVEFYSSSNPGPLGKPTAQKISDDEEVRNWDPTDPDSSNPWAAYLAKKNSTTNTTTNTTNANTNTTNTAETTTTTTPTNIAGTSSETTTVETSTSIENTTNNVIENTTNEVGNEIESEE